MKVSVIIPNFNHEDFLKERIETILSQTYQDFEIIILDDCSLDNSRSVIEKISSNNKVSKVIFKDVNSKSPFGLWEEGISNSSGELIWIAESDDFCELNFLEVLVKYFDDPTVCLAYSSSDYFINNLKLFKPLTWLDSFSIWKSEFVLCGHYILQNYGIYRCTVLNVSSAIFKKDSLNEIIIPKQFKYAGDWYFWNQLFIKGKVAYSPKILNHIRVHSNSATNESNSDMLMKLIEYSKVLRLTFEILERPFIFSNDYKWLLIMWKKYLKKDFFRGIIYFFLYLPFSFWFPFFLSKK